MMKLIFNNMKWIMVVSGLLTFTMIYAAIAPQAALTSTFGTALTGPLAEIIVRNWGALVALVGVMLVYGGYRPAHRPFILMVAGIGKLIFIALVLIYGQQYLNQQAGIIISIDLVMVTLYAIYLGSTQRVFGNAKA
jgi:hypothetical protein